MKARMGNLYQLRDFLKEEHDIIGQIESALKKQNPKADVYRLMVLLQHILNEETLKQLSKMNGSGIGFSSRYKVAPEPIPTPSTIPPPPPSESLPSNIRRTKRQSTYRLQIGPIIDEDYINGLSDDDLSKLYIETRDKLGLIIYSGRRKAEYDLDPVYRSLGKQSGLIIAELRRRGRFGRKRK
jgi:hypothetical protein